MRQYRRRAANLLRRTQRASLAADRSLFRDVRTIEKDYEAGQIGPQTAENALRDRWRIGVDRARLAWILDRLKMPAPAAAVATDDEVRQILAYAHQDDDDSRNQHAFALLDDIRRRYHAQK